jgi:hypothetical protein
VRVSGSSTPLPTNVATTVGWNSEVYDTANMFTLAHPDRLTAPVTGTYVVTGVAAVNIGGLTFGGPVALGFVEIDQAGNSGSTHFIGLESFQANFNGMFAHTVTGMVRMSANDYVTMVVSVGAPTSSMGIVSSFSMVWIGP